MPAQPLSGPLAPRDLESVESAIEGGNRAAGGPTLLLTLPPPHLPCFHSTHHWGNRPWDGKGRRLPRAQRLPGILSISISRCTPRHSPFLCSWD